MVENWKSFSSARSRASVFADCGSGGSGRARARAAAAGRDRSPTGAGRRSPAPLRLVEARDAPARPRVRQDPEVAAAGDRQVERAPPHRRARHFEQRILALQQVRVARRGRDAVAIVVDREDAGVVAVAFLDQDVERPQRSRRDRVARRAVAEHRRAGAVLEQRPSRGGRRRGTPSASGRRPADARSRATRSRGPRRRSRAPAPG